MSEQKTEIKELCHPELEGNTECVRLDSAQLGNMRIKGTCPHCGEEGYSSFCSDSLKGVRSHESFNAAFFCGECGEKSEVRLMVYINVYIDDGIF